MEAAEQLLKKGKSAGVDDIPAELVQAGGEDVITALTTICDRRMANSMDPVLSHHTSQGRQPAAVPELPNDQPHQSPKQSHSEQLSVSHFHYDCYLRKGQHHSTWYEDRAQSKDVALIPAMKTQNLVNLD